MHSGVNPSSAASRRQRRLLALCLVTILGVVIFAYSFGFDWGDDVTYAEAAKYRKMRLPPLGVAKHIAGWLGENMWNGMPLKDTGKIPNRLFVTWKTTTLPPRAAELLKWWETREPQLERVILTDKDCAWLAEQYPDLKPRYDALSMNVMRADICRVLAIYYFGGLYKDLDVAWVQPLSNWLDRNQHVVYGHEDDEHLCQWFFAARPGDPCIRNVLQHITNIIDNVTVDFNKNVEAVIDITGPGAFTDAMRGCPTPPRFSVNDMKFTMIHHEYAAQRWQTDQYASWLQDRKTHAGWQGIWPSDIRLNYYVLQPTSNFLAPLAQHLPALGVRAVATSSAFANNPYFFGAHLAVDGSLDTAFHTIEGSAAQWFDLELDAPLTIGTIAVEDASRLTGIRLYNAKRLGNAMSAFNDGFFIELYDAENKLVFRSAKRFGTLAFQVIPFGGMPAHVRRIRVTKPDKLLTFSEIQLFSDPGLKAARRLVLLSEQTTAPELPPLLRLGSTVNASSAGAACPDSVAVALESRYLFSLCHAPKPPCSAVVLSNSTTPAPVDREFIEAMSRAGCAFLAFTRVAPAVPVMHTEATWCTPTETGVRCDNAKQIVETLTATKAQERIMLVDASESDWLSPDSIVEYALQVRPQTLLLVLHFTSETSTSAVALAHAAKLSSQYDLVAWHIQHSGGFHAMPRADDTLVHVPKELHTTWHLRP